MKQKPQPALTRTAKKKAKWEQGPKNRKLPPKPDFAGMPPAPPSVLNDPDLAETWQLLHMLYGRFKLLEIRENDVAKHIAANGQPQTFTRGKKKLANRIRAEMAPVAILALRYLLRWVIKHLEETESPFPEVIAISELVEVRLTHVGLRQLVEHL